MRELQERIDSQEFAEMVAYYNLEPWGEIRADLRSGIVAATIANSAMSRGRSRAYQPSEFMPVVHGGRTARQSNKEIDARLMAFVEAHNAALKGR